MQDKKTKRSNARRTEEMRSKLLDVGRALFAEKGFAETSTPEIVAAASVTRGALYHHFKDKTDLFRTIVEREAVAVADAIEKSAPRDADPQHMLFAGAACYFDAMAEPGRLRLLLIDGPSVLGASDMQRIFAVHGVAQLEAGLAATITDSSMPISALADIIAAAFDRAALAISEGGDEATYRQAVTSLLTALTRQ